jgi:hypothetical protein
MTIAQVRSDTLGDLLAEFGVQLTQEQIDSVSKDFVGHIEMEREMESYQFIGPTTCQACLSKQRTIDKLEENINKLSGKIVELAKVPRDSSVFVERGYVEIQEPMR